MPQKMVSIHYLLIVYFYVLAVQSQGIALTWHRILQRILISFVVQVVKFQYIQMQDESDNGYQHE